MARLKTNRWLSSLVAGIFAFMLGTVAAQIVQRPLDPATGKSAGVSYFASGSAPTVAADGELAIVSQGVGNASQLQMWDSSTGADAWIEVPNESATAVTFPNDVTLGSDEIDAITVNSPMSVFIFRDDFCGVGVLQNDGTIESGVDTEINDIFTVANPAGYYQFVEQTATLSMAQPANTSGAGCGLDVSGDITANDGHEIIFHKERLGSVYVVDSATDEFYFEISITIADISAFDGDWATGLMLPEAQINPPQHDGLNTYVLWTLSDNTGDLDVEADVDGGGAAADDGVTTWADGETHILRLEIDGDGYAAYVDGTAVVLTNVNASGSNDFTDLDNVVPFYYHTQGAEGAATGVVINYVEWGYGAI